MKYNRTYHLPFSKGVQNDDRIQHDTKSIIGEQIIITEKIDGGNGGMSNDSAFERSHAVATTAPWTQKLRMYHDAKVKGRMDNGVMLFGEATEAIHSIEYQNLTSPFYLFAVRENTHWCSWEQVLEYAYIYDIPTAPVLFSGVVNSLEELENLINEFMTQGSRLGGEIEGVVVRTSKGFENEEFSKSVFKYVRANHVQSDEHWSKNWKKSKIKNESNIISGDSSKW